MCSPHPLFVLSGGRILGQTGNLELLPPTHWAHFLRTPSIKNWSTAGEINNETVLTSHGQTFASSFTTSTTALRSECGELSLRSECGELLQTLKKRHR
jgi:hypothetical protein